MDISLLSISPAVSVSLRLKCILRMGASELPSTPCSPFSPPTDLLAFRPLPESQTGTTGAGALRNNFTKRPNLEGERAGFLRGEPCQQDCADCAKAFSKPGYGVSNITKPWPETQHWRESGPGSCGADQEREQHRNKRWRNGGGTVSGTGSSTGTSAATGSSGSGSGTSTRAGVGKGTRSSSGNDSATVLDQAPEEQQAAHDLEHCTPKAKALSLEELSFRKVRALPKASEGKTACGSSEMKRFREFRAQGSG